LATKLELAESLTIDELKALAEEYDVDVSDAQVHADYAEAVAEGVTKDVLESATATEASAEESGGADASEPGQPPEIGPPVVAADHPGKGPAELEEPEPAPEIGSPVVPPEGSDALLTPSGYALANAGDDPDEYARLRAEKRYG
jgi:hypothetical protein